MTKCIIRGLGGSYTEEAQNSVGICCTGGACHRVKQLIFSFLHDNDWAKDCKLEGGKMKQGIGRAMSWVLMLGAWPEDSRVRVGRQINPMEAEHDPMEMMKAVRDLSREQAVREDDKRSNKAGLTF